MIKFIENINILDLNPHNGFLGSDYQDNLWSLGICLLPGLAKYASGIKVLRCFASEDYIKKNLLDDPEDFNWVWRKYSRGLGIKLTWDNFSFETALAISNDIIDNYAEKCHCIINTKENSLEILRRMRNRRITEKTVDSTKKIRLEK